VFPFLRSSPQPDESRLALDRAVALLQGYQRAGAVAVPVADVLEMLGVAPETVPPPEKTLDPRADPVTGCMPVTPG
jgi:hypothetical protein